MSIIKSVQHFSITVSAATSNTATINAVTTANSVIIFGNALENDVTDDPNHYLVGLTLTNTTTVTATKNNATNSVTVTGCVVEFAAGVLKTNQSGIISVTSVASATATITGVTTANSVVLFQGMTYTSATAAPENTNARLALTDTTTVTATRNSSNANTTAVYYTVLEFNSGILNSSTQERHPQLTTTGTSNTDTITSVTTGQTMLFWGGFDLTQTTVHREGCYPSVVLTNATTLTITRADSLTGTITATVTVVEFKAADIKSIQRGTNSIAAAGTTADNTITSVDTTKAAMNYVGQTYQKTTANADRSVTQGNIKLAGATTVTGTRQTADASFGLNTSWEVVEFAPFVAGGIYYEKHIGDL